MYHVLRDENKFTSDELQQFCYNLCFISQRATRSIEIVSPSYRALIAANNARMFLEGEEGSDTASVGSRGHVLSNFTFKRLAEGMELTQYYV
jgi:eukaryotic translation initiation factor 2C